MKVFDNIDAFQKERRTLAGLGDTGMEYFTSELKRIITDLIPLRKSRNATEVYYRHNLCYDDNVLRFEESQEERRLNGEEVPHEKYRPSKQECTFSTDILHTALITVLQDDRYSFGHIYWFLCSRYNRQIGYAFYDDIVISNKAIEYAVDFDIEDLQKNFQEISDLVDRMDFAQFRLLASKGFESDPTDAVLTKLKNRYESLAQNMLSLAEARYSSLVGTPSDPRNKRKETPQIEDSIGLIDSGDTDYLTYFDFSACPVDVSLYPFSLHLSRYKVIRTTRGLEDSNPIMIDLLKNAYKQVMYAGNDGAKDIFDDTRELLQSLFRIYLQESVKRYPNDYDALLRLLKWWSMNAIRCLDTAFTGDILPASNMPAPEYNVPDYRDEAWKKCNFYRKTMDEYCLYLTVNAVAHYEGNPYYAVHSVIPFNYYGEKYEEVVSQASKKRIKTDRDRIASSFVPNCGHFKPYLEERLSALDGKDINAPDAVNERHQIVADIIEMANSYITHIEEAGVSDPSAHKYAFEFWIWFVRCTMDYLIVTDFHKKIFAPLPSEVKSDDDLVFIHNTTEQYKSFRLYYNKQSVLVQKEFMNDCLKRIAEKEETEQDASVIAPLVDDRLDDTLTPGPRRGSSRKLFKDCILSSDEADRLLAVLHSLIDGKSGKNAYIIIYAAFKGGYINKPSFNAAKNEFSFSGSESGYNRFFNQTLLPKDLDPISNKIKEELKKRK